MKLIHYGNSTYQNSMVKPVINQNFVKPIGGLWASPIDSTYGWKEWCVDEDFDVDQLDSSFELELDMSANIIKIDCEEDLDKLMWILTPYDCVPDFEGMARAGVQAIWLTVEGQLATRFSKPFNLYGWDCESVLIMDPSCVR